MGDPTYTKNLNLAYRESYVFKFADRVGMRFSCEIKLCVKDSGGCNDITVNFLYQIITLWIKYIFIKLYFNLTYYKIPLVFYKHFIFWEEKIE